MDPISSTTTLQQYDIHLGNPTKCAKDTPASGIKEQLQRVPGWERRRKRRIVHNPKKESTRAKAARSGRCDYVSGMKRRARNVMGKGLTEND